VRGPSSLDVARATPPPAPSTQHRHLPAGVPYTPTTNNNKAGHFTSPSPMTQQRTPGSGGGARQQRTPGSSGGGASSAALAKSLSKVRALCGSVWSACVRALCLRLRLRPTTLMMKPS
jgi:hypothetical protein